MDLNHTYPIAESNRYYTSRTGSVTDSPSFLFCPLIVSQFGWFVKWFSKNIRDYFFYSSASFGSLDLFLPPALSLLSLVPCLSPLRYACGLLESTSLLSINSPVSVSTIYCRLATRSSPPDKAIIAHLVLFVKGFFTFFRYLVRLPRLLAGATLWVYPRIIKRISP